jgi:hypothetical protein
VSGGAPSSQPDAAAARIASLRGAAVEVDARRVARIATVTLFVALLGVSAALFVAGARKNAQVTALRDHGVAVAVTVTSCRGLLGGSGSNLDGYTCQGTYLVGARRYRQTLPTSVLYAPGTRVALLADADDPALLSTRALVASEHASVRVYLAPSALLAVVLVAVGVLAWRRSRRKGSVLAR